MCMYIYIYVLQYVCCSIAIVVVANSTVCMLLCYSIACYRSLYVVMLYYITLCVVLCYIILNYIIACYFI